jgi:hypothetical protein
MLTGKAGRVPKRQIEEINGEEQRIFQLLSGSGINRKPYATDEYQNNIPGYIADQELQKKLDKQRENL